MEEIKLSITADGTQAEKTIKTLQKEAKKLIELQKQITRPGKKWYKSKTLFVNLIAIGAVIVMSQTGNEITSDEALALLAVVNMGLRLITGEGLEK